MKQLSPSNREKGEHFVRRVGDHLAREGYSLKNQYVVEVGLNGRLKKAHRFDLGNDFMVVECKYYSWTEGGNNPSAKLSTLNEAIMYLHAAPRSYRKLAFISKTAKKGARQPQTLAEYYVRLHGHLIPDDIEIWELDCDGLDAHRVHPG